MRSGVMTKRRTLRQILINCQQEVWENDCTWAKALQNALARDEITVDEHRSLFKLCRGVARPGMDTKDVIIRTIQHVDIVSKKGTWYV